MIKYPEADYVRKFSADMAEQTAGLPLYQGGPGVDYRKAPHAYALNVTLLFDRQQTPNEVRANGLSLAAQVLLVERGGGDGVVGSLSGITGYIDTLRDPSNHFNEQFDPIVHTLQDELMTECGFTESSLRPIDFYAGPPRTYNRSFYPGTKITMVPVLGLSHELPDIVVDGQELKSHVWVDVEGVHQVQKLARGYLERDLPAALGTLSLGYTSP